MICTFNFSTSTTRDISKLSQISLAYRLVKLPITISKYPLWYLCKISLQIMVLPILICNFKCENCKIAMATFRTSQGQDGDEVYTIHEWRWQGIKRALENLNTRKSESRKILTGILSKNSESSELKPNLGSKRLREKSLSIDTIQDKQGKHVKKKNRRC